MNDDRRRQRIRIRLRSRLTRGKIHNARITRNFAAPGVGNITALSVPRPDS
jgi:hypothetical protein